MKLFKWMTDGGPESNSRGFFLIECKSLFSIAVLVFTGQTRQVFHEHAFHCLGWVLKGFLKETMRDGREYTFSPSIFPFFVGRRDYHQVSSPKGKTYVFTIRGPWVKTWREETQNGSDRYVLTNGRQRI